MISFFALKHLRVMRGSIVAYDAEFHLGVNIIRGENSSGKSTVSDFIFYGLGGEFDRWKDAAAQCSSVRLEVETSESIITLHRSIGTKQEPIYIYYGSLEDSLSKGVDEWQRLSIRRSSSGRDLSFTQVMFRAAGLPDAPSLGNSNVTMHQILRLLYSDQQTPAGKLFRFESFDTRDIREAVGHLLIGINSYELYELQIKLRELNLLYAEKDRLYKAALLALPRSEGLASVAALDIRIGELNTRKNLIISEIENVDIYVDADQISKFVNERRAMQARLRKASKDLQEAEQAENDLIEELDEIKLFRKSPDRSVGSSQCSREFVPKNWDYRVSVLSFLSQASG